MLRKSHRRRTSRRNHPRRLLLEPLESRRLLTVFEVTSTADVNDPSDGVLTLWEAISQANATPNSGGPDEIRFNIPTTDPGYNASTGAFTIQPTSQGASGFPYIRDAVVLDGWSQPGWQDSPIIELDGSLAASFTGGLTIYDVEASGSVIRGFAINRFGRYALNITGAHHVTVQGNYIGLDVTGAVALGNDGGVTVDLANHALIGSNGDGINDELERNVISRNGGAGVNLSRSSDTVIAGNYIGTDSSGTVALGGQRFGISVSYGTLQTLIGTNADGVADEAERNVVAGNTEEQLHNVGLNTLVAGNYIGVDSTGSVGLGAPTGINLGGSDALIGTNGDGVRDDVERNVISGNQVQIWVNGPNDIIAGNFIGTDASGTIAIGGPSTGPAAGQPTFGVILDGGGHRVGTDANGVGDEAERNVIAGLTTGISVRGPNALVAGNWIGVAANGAPLGNSLDGVFLRGNANNNQIGGEGPLGNLIAHNGRAGVTLSRAFSLVNNQIRGNSIHSNGELGIDLQDGYGNGFGVTRNDLGDVDSGVNNLQNFPVLTSVSGGAATRVIGTLNSTPNMEFTIDFYANSSLDPSGYGEGERWLGSTTVASDGNGDVTFDVMLSAPSASGEYITSTATDAGGNTSEFSQGSQLVNVPPIIISANAADVPENQTTVIDVQATDPDGDTEGGGGLTYAVSGGVDGSLFSIDPNSGLLAFVAGPDFEAAGDADHDNIYEVQVTVRDSGGLTDVQDIRVSVLNQATISGQVFVDVDQDGLFDANEPGIDGVVIQLLDQAGNPVVDGNNQPITAATNSGGFYLLDDLDPGTYQLQEVQPSGVDDGPEQLGSLGGTIVANDTMQFDLNRTDASDYVFAELGQQVTSGDTATIGFWQNKHGQALIKAGGAALQNWLENSFGNVFGNVFQQTSVADFYKQELFKQQSSKSGGPARVGAQFMATAFATYFTSSNLAGTIATDYGFNVTDTGIGTNVVNVGGNGAAFGVADETDLTIMQLLRATNALTDQPDSLLGASRIYDTNGDGVIDSAEASLRAKANSVYTSINEGGDI